MKIIKYKNKYLSYIQKQSYKFAVVLVVVSMFASFSNINQTYAYFSDEATVSGNTFTAGTLDISLDNTNTFSSDLLYPIDTTSTSMDISNTGSLDSQYIAKTTLEGSNTSACDYVTMTAINGAYTYTGLIKDFVSSKTPTIDTTWNYDFTVSSTAPASVWGKTCYFNWNYTAWQSNLSDASSGFTSVKEKLGSIRIGKAVVLNEILYNPKSTAPVPANKEFIELFNNSNIAIDVAGWQVSEISGSTEQKYTITATTGLSLTAVPYGGSTIISANGFITLQLSDSTALNNDGDTVRLYDASNNKLDEHAYTGDKPQGYSDARIPDGVGAWVDPIPTPGEPNIDGEVELLLENDSPVILDQTIDTLIKEIMGNSTEEVVEETTIEQPATDTTTDGTITVDQPAQDTEDATAPAPDEDSAIEPEVTELEPAIEEVTVIEPVVEEVVSEPVAKEETEPTVEDVVEPVITE